MSGPIGKEDVTPAKDDAQAARPPRIEIMQGRSTTVGGLPVHRALPRRNRRTIGAWCFVDHFGPSTASDAMVIGPHPHVGLQAVTWLYSGSVLHRDSLGSEQLIEPGQLNLMTSGNGVTHAEVSTSETQPLHGLQLWVALPDSSRSGEAAFEHHAELPLVELQNGEATVIAGRFGDVSSPARSDTALVGVDLALRSGTSSLPLRADFEYGIVAIDQPVKVDGAEIEANSIAYLGKGRSTIDVDATYETHALLIGGEPFDEEIFMWWNYVVRNKAEAKTAYVDWQESSGRFGNVISDLAPMTAPVPFF